MDKLIHCKDCRYYHVDWDVCKPTHYHTDYWCEWVEPREEDFCSLAEEKTDYGIASEVEDRNDTGS